MSESTAEGPVSVESATELAKRAFALGKYEEAVGFYATALELVQEKYGDTAPEYADLLLLYGKALLENAVAQSAVLGKEEAAAEKEEEDKITANKASKFVFGGDGADDDEVEFKQAGAHDDDDDDDDEGEGEGDDSPEDDFNAAWEVLDLARALYEKRADEGDDVKLKVADTYIALGDVSLETEKFDQAISDYTSGLKLKSSVLPPHNRQIAEAHYKLGLVLDLTSGRLGDAITHVEKAVESISARLALLRVRADGGVLPSAQVEAGDEGKGKGKGKEKEGAVGLSPNDPIAALTPEQVLAEIKEFEELKKELENKIDDLKSAPAGLEKSAPALAAEQLTKELAFNAISSASASGSGSGSGPAFDPSAPVNDLSGMVKKKKKTAAPTADSTAAPATGASLAVDAKSANGNGNAPAPSPAGSTGKRKLEDDADDSVSPGPEKKARLEEPKL